MGLDTSHGAWHGAYSAFMRWREAISCAAGLPPLGLMEAFFEKDNYMDPFRDFAKRFPSLGQALYDSLPIRWDALKPSPLHELLYHSDCDGQIEAKRCGPIADALEELLPKLEKMGDSGGHIGSFAEKTKTFIAGLREAAAAGEPLDFH